MVIAVSGLPGSGKSYFASRLALRLGATYLSSDLIRKEIISNPDYTTAEKNKVYDEMLERMKREITSGKNLVLDATFYTRKQRQRFYHATANRGLSWRLIIITASEELIKKRLSEKRENSDADRQVYQKLKEDFAPIYQHHLVLHSTDNNIDDMINTAMQYLGKA